MSFLGLSNPLVVFRADASLGIGTGHVMRCLTLADALRARAVKCVFLCRPGEGDQIAKIAEQGYQVVRLTQMGLDFSTQGSQSGHDHWVAGGWENDAAETLRSVARLKPDLLIVDHYGLDDRWEAVMRQACSNIMVFDDLADRPHDCDILLDPTLGRTNKDYASLVPGGARLLLGPLFALLRQEFSAHRSESLARRRTPPLKHILVSLGGVDRDNATSAILTALDKSRLPEDLTITVVMGRQSPHLNAVKDQAVGLRYRTHVEVGVSAMARLMTDSDLAIGAGGGTSWERCCLGLPTIMLVIADNQTEMARSLRQAGAVFVAESAKGLAAQLENMISSPNVEQVLCRASEAAACITDGLGAERVCEVLGR